jgi:site-specific recombinase XerD
VTAVDVDELLPLWEMSLAAGNKSRKTIDLYITGVTQYIKWCRDNDRPVALDRRGVEEWTAHLLKSFTPATARARQTALRQFSKWLTDEKEIPSNDLLALPAPKLDEKVVDALTDDELKRVLQACQGTSFRDRRDEAMLRLMAETGMRAGEVIAMAVDDVDVKTGYATIVRGKGGRGRVVSFGPKTQLAIGRYLRLRRTHRLADTPQLWLGAGGQTYSYAGMQRAFEHRGRLAGVPRLHPHLLRHTAATRWRRAGGSEEGAMQVMGWRSHDMLLRYTRATASERAAVESRKLNLGDV